MLHGGKDNLNLLNIHAMKKWYAIFALLFILCIDFWNWNKNDIFIFMPYWTWYIFFLTISFSIIFYIFAKYEWREEK